MISWFEKHNKISWLITILIAITIFYLSSKTFTTGPSVGLRWQPIAYHFYAFLFLSSFLLFSLIKGNPKNKKLIPLAIMILILYGISDEIHQLFVPGRHFAISDILIDSAGILFASVLYSLLRFDEFNNYKTKYYKTIKKEVLKK